MLHLVLTRYNIGAQRRVPRLLNMAYEDWWNLRLRIFQECCYPSMLQQTNSDFLWLIAVDQDTPANQLHELRAILQPANFLMLRPSSYEWQFGAQTLREFLPTTIDYVITTKVDSDDMLCRTFIEMVQREYGTLQERDRVIIDCDKAVNIALDGSRYQWINYRVHFKRDPVFATPFFSTVESVSGELVTCCGVRHSEAKPAFNKHLAIENAAARIIGSRNLVNTFGNVGPRSPRLRLRSDNWEDLEREFGFRRDHLSRIPH